MDVMWYALQHVRVSEQVKQNAGLTWNPTGNDNGKRVRSKPGRFRLLSTSPGNPTNTLIYFEYICPGLTVSHHHL